MFDVKVSSPAVKQITCPSKITPELLASSSPNFSRMKLHRETLQPEKGEFPSGSRTQSRGRKAATRHPACHGGVPAGHTLAFTQLHRRCRLWKTLFSVCWVRKFKLAELIMPGMWLRRAWCSSSVTEGGREWVMSSTAAPRGLT